MFECGLVSVGVVWVLDIGMFVLNLLFEVIFDVWCDMMFVGCVCVFEGIFELSCKCVDEFDMIFGEGGLLVCVFDGYWLCML